MRIHGCGASCRLDEHRADVERYFAGDRREPAEVLLAFSPAGEPAGLAELSIRSIADGCSTGNVAYLEGWYVTAAFRRQGVGRMLTSAAESWAKGRGCTEFASDAELANHISQTAHLQVGFEETGRVVTYRKWIL